MLVSFIERMRCCCLGPTLVLCCWGGREGGKEGGRVKKGWMDEIAVNRFGVWRGYGHARLNVSFRQ